MTDDTSADVGHDVPTYREANLAAVLQPPHSGDDPAGIELAGAYISVWLTADRVLHVSVELGEAAGWLRQADGTVPLQLSAGAEVLFAGDMRPPDPPGGAEASRSTGEVIPIARGRAGRQPPFNDL